MSHDVYIKRTKINTPVQRLFAWNERNGPIQRLTPPWAPLKMIARSGDDVKKGVKVIFRLNFLDLCGLSVICRFDDFSIKLHSPTVICIHWLTAIVLAPLGVFYGGFAIFAVIGYSFIMLTLFFSGNKKKIADE